MTIRETNTKHTTDTVHVILNDGGDISSVCIGRLDRSEFTEGSGLQSYSPDYRSAPIVKNLSN